MDARISGLSTPKECDLFRKEALALNLDDLANEARLRKIQIKTEEYPTTNEVEKECIKAIYAYEEVLLDKNPNSKGARRTWPDIKSLGVIQTVEKAVMKRSDPSGYSALVDMGLEGLSFESIIIRHPNSFSAVAVSQSKLRLSSLKQDSKLWTDEEIRASVAAYLEMLNFELLDSKYSKKEVYEALSKKFNRTTKSIEFRMQNISYVLYLLGRLWIKGLKPARNVGVGVATKIEAILFELEGIPNINKVAFEYAVQDARNRISSHPPSGNSSPTSSIRTVSQINRDHKVRAWVLKRAKGKCECCTRKAPFLNALGEPFLEVHHLHQLADKGGDTVDNAVALCPNCHRELHYGMNAHELAKQLKLLVIRS